jgi:hypothetical protein
VFAKVHADSCGLRGLNKYYKYAQFFSLCRIILSTPTHLAGAKSTSTYFLDYKINELRVD